MTKQTWNTGDTVKVGFLSNLTVLEKVATPGDYRPDLYVLQSTKGQVYRFTPHHGIERCDSVEYARDW